MRKLKILVNCAGSWSHGLDSPERGEGRWAQNLARLFGKNGHDVYASSAGDPKSIGRGRPASGVTLIGDHSMEKHGPYDLYIDSAWWDGKRVPKNSSFYLRCHWQLEHFLRKPLPTNMGIVFPYEASAPNFLHDLNPNKERTFFLPTPFCEKMADPVFDNKDILWPCRPDDVFRGGYESYQNGNAVVSLIKDYLAADSFRKAHWLFGDGMRSRKELGISDDGQNVFHKPLPYCEVVELVKKCKLVVPINLPSCIIDALVCGVAPLTWANGSWDSYSGVAETYGVKIKAAPERKDIQKVFDRLLNDRETYINYVRGLQDLFKHHTDEESLNKFNLIIESFLK